MKHFEHNGQKYLAVEVPESGFMFSVDKGDLHYYFEDRDYTFNHNEPLPAGNYEIVGLLGKIRNNHSNGFEFFMDAINNNPWNALREFNNLSDNDLILKLNNQPQQ